MLDRLRTSIARALVGRSQWDAASTGNRLANWNVQPATPNQYWENPTIVRARALNEYLNNPWARRGVDTVVNAAIGAAGINPKFKEKAVAEKFDVWSDDCDAAGRADWIAIEQQILQTVIVSGECYVRFVINESVEVPLALQILGPEFLDTSRVDRSTFAGIRYEGVKRVGYWIYERHPSLTLASLLSVFVPAAEILHIFRPHAPGAEHGVSWLAPVLLALRELQEYTEASLVRAKVGALYSGYVRTPDGTNPLSSNTGVPSLEPGSMVRLNGGEEVQFTEPPDNGDFDPFVKAQLRKIAAGMNIPYEILSGDLSSVTFASGRHGLLEFRRFVENVQHGLMVQQFCQPVLAKWASFAQALGVIPEGPVKARWIGPQVAMLDEAAETRNLISEIRAGLTSRTEVVLTKGWNVEDIDAEIAADNTRADALGLTLDSDPRKVTSQGQQQQTVVAEASQP